MTKLLVVDDDPAQRARLKHTLEAAGYVIITASDAIQGLVAVTRDPPDLILSDILMPRMNGFTFIREMKSRPELRSIPFLFVTSTLVSEDDRQFAQMLGAEAILARSDDTAATLSVIESCLKRHTRTRPPTGQLAEAAPGPLQLPDEMEGEDAVLARFSPEDEQADEETLVAAEPGEAPTEILLLPAPAMPSPISPTAADQTTYLERNGEQRAILLEAKIEELEQANHALERRAEELSALAAEREQLLEQIQAHAAELEEQVTGQTARLNALAVLSKVINTSSSSEPLMEEIARRAAESVHSTTCSLFLHNAESDTFQGAASSRLDRDSIRKLFFSARGSTALNAIIRAGATAALCELRAPHEPSTSSEEAGLLPLEIDARAILLAPLVAHDRVHGVLICADSTSEREFGEDEIDVIAQLADQAALGLENALLLGESSRRQEHLRDEEEEKAAELEKATAEREELLRAASDRARELEEKIRTGRQHLTALAQISRVLNAASSPEGVLDRIVQSARDVIRVDTCSLFLLTPENGTFRGAASSSMTRESIQKLSFSAEKNEPVQSIVEHRAAVALDDTDSEAVGFPMLAEAFHAKAALITPIVARGQVLGMILCVDANAHRTFTDDEIDLLSLFADQAANALENARLYREMARVLDELGAAQEQLAQAQKLAAAVELVGAAVRELSQPLSIVFSQRRRLQQQPFGQEVLDELERIQAQTLKMGEIVEQMQTITLRKFKPYAEAARAIDPPRSAGTATSGAASN